jgi:hypothetical protein
MRLPKQRLQAGSVWVRVWRGIHKGFPYAPFVVVVLGEQNNYGKTQLVELK